MFRAESFPMSRSVPLSLVVIAKDEADRISRCLRSVPPGAEVVVVVDANTRDDTAAVAADCGARIVTRPWPGHVRQKQLAATLATREWVLSLDADEWLSTDAADQVAAAVASPGPAAGFSFPRCSDWLGRPIRHGRWYPDRKLRLFRRGLAQWGGDDPHDRLLLDGPVVALTGEIRHEPYRTLAEHHRTLEAYAVISARSLAARGVRAKPTDRWLRPLWHWLDAVVLRSAWRDGAAGMQVAGLGAWHVHRKWTELGRL
jgi:glycosyltransferase involved in cell wall biosynthesis